ncbi:hypothetical protein [Flavobacterium koreense]
MKVFTLLVLTIFMAKGCSQEAKNDIANAKIVYTANTRGFYQKITIQNQEISVSKERDSSDKGVTSKISDADWKELVGYFEKIELDSLSTYKDPTQKRVYDGAAIAELIINYQEKEYQTKNFDHGYPPVEIEKFVNKLVSLVKEE